MRVLLDENVDRKLTRAFDPEHEVVTVRERGWSGMTGNALRDLFIENYNRVDAQGNVLSRSVNQEEQIRLLAQACCTLDGIDAEGSKTRVLSATDCVLEITNLYLEHIEVQGLYPKLIYFGIGQYALRGLNLDGLMYALPDPNLGNSPSFSTIINGEGGAEIIISGVRGYPFAGLYDGKGNPTPALDRDPDFGGGVLPLNGPAFFVGGGNATYRLLDRPLLPVRPAADRGQVTYEPAGQTLTLDYREMVTFADGAGAANMTAVVHAPTVKAKRLLDFPSIPARSVGVLQVGACLLPFSESLLPAPITGAAPGDLVTLGPPANLPAGLVFSGIVVLPECVEIRLFNTAATAVNPPSGEWTIEVGGGPQAGAAQETTDFAALTPPYASKPIPPFS